jgi:SAM-dependent methyltransferase
VRSFDIEYLRRASREPVIQALKHRAYDLLSLGPGDHVVDVGCGPAIDTISLAARVGPAGTVLGIDADPSTVIEANRTSVAAGFGGVATHRVANATMIPIPDASVDACYCDRVLQHLVFADAERTVHEMARIVRAGRKVVVIDTDWASFSISCESQVLERRVAYEHLLSFANPCAGRTLLGVLRRSGLVDVAVESTAVPLSFEATTYLLGPSVARAVALGRLSALEAQRFLVGLRVASEYGAFYAHVSMVTGVGTVRGVPR